MIGEPALWTLVGVLASASAGLLAYFIPRELGRVDRTSAKQATTVTDVAVIVARVGTLEEKAAKHDASLEAAKTELHERVNRLAQRTSEHEKTTAEAIGELKGVMGQIRDRLDQILDAERARTTQTPPRNAIDQLRDMMEMMTLMKQFKAV